MATRQFEFDVALSFAGEDRPYVDAVASLLQRAGAKIFYDAAEIDDLWGKNLSDHLDEVYRLKARYCVMFISAAYRDKKWTNHERASAQARALEERQEYILPARFDDTEIPSLKPTIAYVDLRKIAPEEFALMVLKKIGVRVFESGIGQPLYSSTWTDDVYLSPREIECLTWGARGKTSWEISEILGLPERTVNFHFQSAMKKLDAPNRTYAVAKSIGLGLIAV